MEATCVPSVPLLLGVFDSHCPSLYCSPYENKIGGYPDFYSKCALSTPPSCPVCSSPLVLLVQVYCPLENTIYHRLIHIFCCTQPSCHKEGKGCMLALRSQTEDDSLKNEETTPIPATDAGGLMSADQWCCDADDWGCAPDVSTSSSAGPGNETRLEEQLEKLTLDGIKTSVSPTNTSDAASSPVSPTAYAAPHYPPGYLRVVEEPSQYSQGEECSHAKDLLKRYQAENSDTYLKAESSSSKKDANTGRRHQDGDGYEKAVPKHGDRAFQKFHKQILKCPQQLLRYQREGKPLLITDDPAHTPPDPLLTCCRECGASCCFEFQLMPTLVYVLQREPGQYSIDSEPDKLAEAVLKKPDIVEFGTVLVYTCSKSCWSVNSPLRSETVFVQMDNDSVT